MQVHYDIDQLPVFRNAVITIGTFDGVHKGHQKIISTMQHVAHGIDGETVVITFHPHPRKVIKPGISLELINTIDEKIALLDEKGIDHLVIVPFTHDFASLTAKTYIESFLVEKFHPHTIIIGYDHHFGNNREGNFSLLEARKNDFGYELIEIPKQVLNEISVSSTRIREALKSGDVKSANELLGYAFTFSGKVIHGDKLGRELGYPTANLEYYDADKIRLGEGVYAATVKWNNTEKTGMLSIGTRPTFNGNEERVEINIFDFSDEIYGEELKVTPVKFLRPQEKYNSSEELIAQLEKDRSESLGVLSRTSS
jgi:riboflavin kinase / FMN adenylyltransferase